MVDRMHPALFSYQKESQSSGLGSCDDAPRPEFLSASPPETQREFGRSVTHSDTYEDWWVAQTCRITSNNSLLSPMNIR